MALHPHLTRPESLPKPSWRILLYPERKVNAVAVGPEGTVYASVQNDSFVYAISPAGSSRRLLDPASKAQQGFTEPRSPFESPHALAVDAHGNVYVGDGVVLNGGDLGSGLVLKVRPDGATSRMPYITAWRKDQGKLLPYYMAHVQGLAIGKAGTIVVNDMLGGDIYEIPATGKVDTLERWDMGGSRDRPDLAFEGITADSDRGIIGSTEKGAIYRLRKDLPPVLLAGKPGECGQIDGAARMARFCDSGAMSAAPDGAVYVVDGACTVRRIAKNGMVTTVIRSADDSGPAIVKLPQSRCWVTGIAVGDRGELYLAARGLIKVDLALPPAL